MLSYMVLVSDITEYMETENYEVVAFNDIQLNKTIKVSKIYSF